MHLTRYSVAFEVYNPYSIVQLSEVLQRSGHSARGSADLSGPGGDQDSRPDRRFDHRFRCPARSLVRLERAARRRRHPPRDRTLHSELETRLSSEAPVPAGGDQSGKLSRGAQPLAGPGRSACMPTNRAAAALSEAILLDQVWPPLEGKLQELFELFEAEARRISVEETPVHKAFAQRELHPLLMCDPFNHRIFTKPLGYAGDYQMVNMILGPSGSGRQYLRKDHQPIHAQPGTGSSASQPHPDARGDAPEGGAAHGSRPVDRLRALNVGCGPATEIQSFVATDEASTGSELTVVDFNEETLEYAERQITRARESSRRKLQLGVVHQSIHELLKSAASGQSALAGQYDFVYCAGLFDYLSDRVCRKLVALVSRLDRSRRARIGHERSSAKSDSRLHGARRRVVPRVSR